MREKDFSTVHFLKLGHNAAFGGGTKGFGGRKSSFFLRKKKIFCPQRTIFRHVAKRSDGFSKKCTVKKKRLIIGYLSKYLTI